MGVLYQKPENHILALFDLCKDLWSEKCGF